YCVADEDIDEFTDTFAKRVALMPWQVSTQYKRAMKKAYEMMGIRTAMETCSQFTFHRTADTEYVKKMYEILWTKPLTEYLTIRDKPYQDYRTAEEAILARAEGRTHKREKAMDSKNK
ncbi:MAG: hypothetical protein JRH15_06250, partial [Deltaproteobacteria bacterium]|nr:hypothetical protein [Deltaproteobacteria bacterium]